MRPVILAAASALAFAACTPSEPAADSAATAPAAAHDMAAMDDSMKSSDTADDANTAETPEGYTFHSYPAKIEVVHLPAAPTAAHGRRRPPTPPSSRSASRRTRPCPTAPSITP